MSCEYCAEDKIILSKEVDKIPWWFRVGDTITNDHIKGNEIKLGVLIDRQHLRLVDLEDYNCMDHGENIKINYCPFCGDKIGGSYGEKIFYKMSSL